MTPLFIISGPSGAGKSVLIRRLLEDLPGLRFSVSSTTRAPRPGEREGVNYHYISRAEFEKEIAEGRFLEHAEFSGNHYGTSWNEVDSARRDGVDLLLDIEVEGARQLQEKRIEAVYIFIAPPSFAVLEHRLRSRNTEDEASIQRRLRQAVADMSHLHRYQYTIINDVLEDAYATLRAVFIAERARLERMKPALESVLASFAQSK